MDSKGTWKVRRSQSADSRMGNASRSEPLDIERLGRVKKQVMARSGDSEGPTNRCCASGRSAHSPITGNPETRSRLGSADGSHHQERPEFARSIPGLSISKTSVRAGRPIRRHASGDQLIADTLASLNPSIRTSPTFNPTRPISTTNRKRTTRAASAIGTTATTAQRTQTHKGKEVLKQKRPFRRSKRSNDSKTAVQDD